MRSIKKFKAGPVLSLLLAALLLLPLASCAKKDAQQAQAGQTVQHGDPSFDPETDYDNRYSSLVSCDMLETEDAYYLHNCSSKPFLYYFDKATGETGVLCPRPECVHDEKRENRECTGYIGYDWPSLQYYRGKLWYFNSTKGIKFGLFRMNLDGSEKELVHEFDPTGTPLEYGNRRLYIHRGMIYHACSRQEVKNGAPFEKLVYGCIPMENATVGGKEVKAWEYYEILERDTINPPQPCMYFAGDSAYMFYCYDGLAEYDGDMPEDEAWWWDIPVTDEIARWDPSMSEPEILYQSVEDIPVLSSYYNSYVTSDGTPYFVASSRLDPERDEGEDNPYILRLYRVEKDGTKTCVLDTSDWGGNAFLLALGDGFIVTADSSIYYMTTLTQQVNIRIIRFGGEAAETICEGPLPLEFRKEMPVGLKSMHIDASWVTEDTLMLFSTEYYGKKDYNRSWHFVKYDITPDGLAETVVSEGYEIQFWATD